MVPCANVSKVSLAIAEGSLVAKTITAKHNMLY